VANRDAHSAFAQAAGEDGIVFGSKSFGWLCEQGHVGLERVAKLRGDPALVEPVTAAVEQLGAIYARLKGDTRSCTPRARTCCSRSTSCMSRQEP
jgi:hypothetical protein